MRAAKKLATGLVPVALGGAMALVSGMAKAEDQAVQPQTGALSAQTILPSRGHKPRMAVVVTSCNGTANVPPPFPPLLPPTVSPCALFEGSTEITKPGFVIDAYLSGGIEIFKRLGQDGYVHDIDGDTADLKKLMCTWFRVKDGIENIIKTDKCIGGEYRPGVADIGYYIKIQATPQSDITEAESKGYTPLPATGNTWSVTSSAPVISTDPMLPPPPPNPVPLPPLKQ